MSDPQPRYLKDKPKRAEPWQPDRPSDGDPVAEDDAVAAEAHKPKHVVAGHDKPQDTSKAVSAEAAIPRDPQNGQAINDESLTSGKDTAAVRRPVGLDASAAVLSAPAVGLACSAVLPPIRA